MIQTEPAVSTSNMKIHQEVLEIRATGKGFTDITEQVSGIVAKSGIKTGLCTLFIQHTSASLIIQENADPAVLRDLGRWMSEMVPEERNWEHDDEGPDDMPAHVRCVLSHTSETIPVSGSRLTLGTWQGIYLWEHRTRHNTRRIIVHVAGLE